MNKEVCIYYGPAACIMRYACKYKSEDRTCKLSGKIKTGLVYVRKHMRQPDEFKLKSHCESIGNMV